MSKTALQLINKVYYNLREDQIGALSVDYDYLILQFINMAKEVVEDAWQWHTYRQWITWTSVADQKAYDLTNDTADALGTGTAGNADAGSNLWLKGRTKVYRSPTGRIMAFDDTNSTVIYRLTEVPYWYGIEQAQYFHTSVVKPYQIYFDSGGVNYLAAPDSSSRTFKLLVVTPEDELTSASDTCTLPWRPIVSLATAWAVNERGEEMGNRPILPQSVMTTDWALFGEQQLARAISLDQDYTPDEMVMDAGQVDWHG